MLVNEVVNSASIALAATEDASNQIPYLGLQWFPDWLYNERQCP